jgi:hypothetical protein
VKRAAFLQDLTNHHSPITIHLSGRKAALVIEQPFLSPQSAAGPAQ